MCFSATRYCHHVAEGWSNRAVSLPSFTTGNHAFAAYAVSTFRAAGLRFRAIVTAFRNSSSFCSDVASLDLSLAMFMIAQANGGFQPLLACLLFAP